MKHRYLLWTVAISLLHLGLISVRAAGLNAETSLRTRSPHHQIRDEFDATDQQSCQSMGQIVITYAMENAGPPNMGLRITDPRGRKIGYDPRVSKVWQELPIAEGFVECNEIDKESGQEHCKAHIQLCGPVSGTYKLEVLPTQNRSYSIKVVATSESTRDEAGLHSTASRARYDGEILKLSPELLTLNYSREAGRGVSLGKDNAQVAGDKRRAKRSAY